MSVVLHPGTPAEIPGDDDGCAHSMASPIDMIARLRGLAAESRADQCDHRALLRRQPGRRGGAKCTRFPEADRRAVDVRVDDGRMNVRLAAHGLRVAERSGHRLNRLHDLAFRFTLA